MRCPFCRTENRDDRDTCYQCEKDLTMLRLVVNKAKAHFNTALEFAERGRNDDAIAELHHALDLDNHHVNSHVVLGTLYAQGGAHDKAEEQWNEALSIDPRFEKAHVYLEKMHAARKNLPLVRRQRILLIVLLVLTLVLGLLLVKHGTPDPNLTRYAQAWNAYRNQDYSAALEQIEQTEGLDSESLYYGPLMQLGEIILAEQALALDAARQYFEQGDLETASESLQVLLRRGPSRGVRQQAEALRSQVRLKQQERVLAGSRKALENGQLLEAWVIGGMLNVEEMSPEAGQKTKALRADIVLAARDAVDGALEAFREGRLDSRTVAETIAQARRIVPEDPQVRAQYTASLDEADQIRQGIEPTLRAERILAELGDGSIDEWEALARLATLHEDYPDYEATGKLIDRISEPLLDLGERTAKQGLEQNDPDQARVGIAVLERLAVVLGDEAEAREKAAEYARRADQIATRKKLESLRNAFDTGQYAEVTELAPGLLDTAGLDETERSVVATMLKKANLNLALERWKHMVALDGRYVNGSISIEEAERTVRVYDQVAKHLPKSVYPTSHDNLMFYFAMAQRKIGQEAQAAETLEALLATYPDSNITELVNNWLSRLKTEAQ